MVIVDPDDAQSLDVSGPLDAFLEAKRGGVAKYAVRLVSTAARAWVVARRV